MVLFLSALYLLFSSLGCSTEGHSSHFPRMKFTDKESAVKRMSLPGHDAPVWIAPEEKPHAVTAVGQKHLISFNFRLSQTPENREVLWKECIDRRLPQRRCNYNITVVHKSQDANKLFMCGTDGRETLCCDVNLSEQSPMCMPSEKMGNIKESIRDFVIKEGEPSALVESADSADLYITYSGSQEYVGIHKFGRYKVGPANQDKEQHYVGLMHSRRRESLQDRVYAFYKEKNRDTSLDSEMWLPYVTQVCTADIGGPKNTLQFTWTSQLNARLFCGDPDNKQHFSELVDVAFVHADQWQDTRVYALFRNEWGMTAVCVYTIQDIDNIFTASPFIGDKGDRPRKCVSDSTKIHLDVLRMIEKTSEMEKWVRPVNNSGPFLFNHHKYTHIYADSFQSKRNGEHLVLFLSLNNGGIHKVIKDVNQTFLIAEYRPFSSTTHVFGITLHTSSKMLYVNSRSELVQLDVANCAHYGNSCEECVLARDPYCGWDGSRCTAETSGTMQDVTQGDHTICKSESNDRLGGTVFRSSTDPREDKDVVSIRLPSQSKYFLECPVSSHHAKYTWYHGESSQSCNSKEEQCLYLIDSMGPEQEGSYKCVSEEMGYSKVLGHYQLKVENKAAGHSSSLLVWVCLVAVLIVCPVSE